MGYLAEINWCEVTGVCFAIFPGVLFIGLSIPLVLDKIPPNQWYGFRTPKTFSNIEIWYKANRFMARDLIVFGVLHSVFLGIFAFLHYSQMVEINLPGPWTLLMFPFPMVVGLAVVIIRSFLYLKKL